jgi:hypothetical protein
LQRWLLIEVAPNAEPFKAQDNFQGAINEELSFACFAGAWRGDADRLRLVRPTAHADICDWSYTGVGISGSGTFTAAFLNSNNGGTFQVTHMTGTADGMAIVEVLPLGGYSSNDNLLFPNASAELDFAGLAFTVTDGQAFNLYFDTNSTGQFNCGQVGYCLLGPGSVGTEGSTDATAAITFAASAVPEPSTWAMMILGFLGLGWIAHRKKSTLRFA